MRYKSLIILVVPLIIFTACNKKEENKPQTAISSKAATAAHTVTVEDDIHVTYIVAPASSNSSTR